MYYCVQFFDANNRVIGSMAKGDATSVLAAFKRLNAATWNCSREIHC